MSRRVARHTRPVLTLALMEIGVGLFAVISLHVYVALGQSETDFLYLYSQLWNAADFGVLFVTSILIVLPVTLLLGAIFPLVTHLCRGSGPAVNLVGRLYGFNTIGSILGSLITGFVFIPTLGTLMTFLILAAVSFGIGVYLLPRPEHRRTALVSTLLFVAVFSFSLEDPFLRVLQARLPAEDEVIDHREDASATVTVAKSGAKRDLYVNGLYVSSTDFAGRFMMHMPLLIHPAPEASLIIGLGAGEAFSTSMAHGVKTTVVDLLPSVVAHFPTFHPEAPDLPTAEGARVVINDGRNFLLATEDRFDVVLVDGTPPLFASGMVNLYTLEFVQLVQDHLTDDGIFCLWLPLFSFPDDLWMIVRNFTDTFESVRIWARKGVSGVIVLGTKDPNLNLVPSGEELARRIAGRGLREPLLQPLDITQGFFLSQEQIRSIAAEHPTVTDDRPRTEYPLLRFLRGEELVREPDFLFELETSK